VWRRREIKRRHRAVLGTNDSWTETCPYYLRLAVENAKCKIQLYEELLNNEPSKPAAMRVISGGKK